MRENAYLQKIRLLRIVSNSFPREHNGVIFRAAHFAGFKYGIHNAMGPYVRVYAILKYTVKKCRYHSTHNHIALFIKLHGDTISTADLPALSPAQGICQLRFGDWGINYFVDIVIMTKIIFRTAIVYK